VIRSSGLHFCHVYPDRQKLVELRTFAGLRRRAASGRPATFASGRDRPIVLKNSLLRTAGPAREKSASQIALYAAREHRLRVRGPLRTSLSRRVFQHNRPYTVIRSRCLMVIRTAAPPSEAAVHVALAPSAGEGRKGAAESFVGGHMRSLFPRFGQRPKWQSTSRPTE
jgi:hypothetical protein